MYLNLTLQIKYLMKLPLYQSRPRLEVYRQGLKYNQLLSSIRNADVWHLGLKQIPQLDLLLKSVGFISKILQLPAKLELSMVPDIILC